MKDWEDMSACERFGEADRRMHRLIKRRDYMKKHGAPQDWVAHYDRELAKAVNDRQIWHGPAMDELDAARRGFYEQADYGG